MISCHREIRDATVDAENNFSAELNSMLEHDFVTEIDMEVNLIDRCINFRIYFHLSGGAKNILSHASRGRTVLAVIHSLVCLKQVSRVKDPSAKAAAVLSWSF